MATMEAFEHALDQIIGTHRTEGVSLDEIISALELKIMQLKEEEEGEE